MYVMAALSSIGFSAVVPTTISLAQRLLPGRTGLASGLMLGTAWSFSAVAPMLTSVFLGGVKLDRRHTLAASRIGTAFVGLGALLLMGFVLTVMLPGRLLKRVADH